MVRDSFTYNGVDIYALAFLRMVSYNVLMPALRERKQLIPSRHGRYNYGAKYREERVLRMSCLIEREISDAQFDDLKYTLARPGKIVLWDQPDRYYTGQCYDAAEVIDYYRHTVREFELSFVCEPFACREVPALPIAGGINRVDYRGTAETEPLLILRNDSETPVSEIQIVVTRRKL